MAKIGVLLGRIIMQYSATVQGARAVRNRRKIACRESGRQSMQVKVLAICAGFALTVVATPAAAQWRGYISHPLGFAFAAPGAMKVEKGTYNAPVAGQRPTLTYSFIDDNIEYKAI